MQAVLMTYIFTQACLTCLSSHSIIAANVATSSDATSLAAVLNLAPLCLACGYMQNGE